MGIEKEGRHQQKEPERQGAIRSSKPSKRQTPDQQRGGGEAVVERRAMSRSGKESEAREVVPGRRGGKLGPWKIGRTRTGKRPDEQAVQGALSAGLDQCGVDWHRYQAGGSQHGNESGRP